LGVLALNLKHISLNMLLLVLLTNPLLTADRKILTIGVEDIHFLPFSDYEKGSYNGIFKDTLEGFAAKNNYELIWKPLPLNRLYSEFYKGLIDIKIPANEYWQKDKKENFKKSIYYSKPIVSYIDGVMVKPLLKGISKTTLKKLGIVAGFTPWEYLGDIESGLLKLKENVSINGILSQGILGRVDGVYINIDVGEYYLNENAKMKGMLVFDSNLPHTKSSFHLASLKKNEDIVKRFNEYILKHPVQVNMTTQR